MNHTDKIVDKYLTEVGSHLNALVDKDQILNELRQHIWDVAQAISQEENVPETQAFEIALTQMETPKTLAEKFLGESTQHERFSPERKITEQNFLIIGLLGCGFVAVASAIYTIISSETWIFWVFTFIPGMALVLGSLLYFYFYNEKEFQEQMILFREEIQKQFKTGKTAKPVGFWGSLTTHLGGLIGALSVLFAMILVLWIDINDVLPLFNDNWYYTGAFACYIAWITSFFTYLSRLFLGQIRISRLISAADNTIGSLCLTTLFIIYPFTVGDALVSLLGSTIPSFLVNADFFLQIIFGIAAIVMIISAMYDFFRFGIWLPEDKKSLL